MNRTATEHLGWTISATCSKHSPHDLSGPGRYTGHAIAVLAARENDHWWADTRPISSEIISHVFASFEACLAALVAQAIRQIHLQDQRHDRRADASSDARLFASEAAAQTLQRTASSA